MARGAAPGLPRPGRGDQGRLHRPPQRVPLLRGAPGRGRGLADGAAHRERDGGQSVKFWKRAAIVLGLSAAAGFATAASWNAGFEASPAGSDLVSTLDEVIRALKLEVRNRSAVEEVFGVGTDDNGLNRVGSARAFSATAAPTAIAGPGQYNAAAGAYDVATLTATELGASGIDIGTGRLWDDTDGSLTAATRTLDDHLLQVY